MSLCYITILTSLQLIHRFTSVWMFLGWIPTAGGAATILPGIIGSFM